MYYTVQLGCEFWLNLYVSLLYIQLWTARMIVAQE